MANSIAKLVCAGLACTAVVHADTQHTGHARDTARDAHVAPSQPAVYVNAKDIVWQDAPPTLPKGAKLGVLMGDPTKNGPYAIRLKLPDGYRIPLHRHAQDEQLTIMAGTFMVQMPDAAEPHTLTTGGFHFLPANTQHAAQAKGETIVQINGNGPFDIQYNNPADNPARQSARR